MLKTDGKYIEALKEVLLDSNYLFLMNQLHGPSGFFDPWSQFEVMKRALDHLESPYHHTLLLLQLGISAPRAQIEQETGKETLNLILESGFWEERGGLIRCRNLVVLTYQGLYLATEINPWFETCKNKNTDIYIGSDSLRLAECIAWRKDARVLDLCSGTGIQGLLAARSARKVVSVEINPRTVPVTQFNIELNCAGDVMEVRMGDLYEVLDPTEQFDCIYANPPFIPMLENTTYPICGAGGEDGLAVLNRIIRWMPEHLASGGEAVVFCECLGDNKNVFFDREIEKMCMENGWTGLSSHPSRMNAGLQIQKLSELTALFSESFDKKDFKRRMSDVYTGLGAQYLYDTVLRIENNGSPSFKLINGYNPWHGAAMAQAADKVTFSYRDGLIAVLLDGRVVRTVTPDIAELITTLDEGYNVEESAKWLFHRYRKTLIGADVHFYGYLAAVLESCRMLEQDGVLILR